MNAPTCTCSSKSSVSKNLGKLSVAGALIASLGICAACCLLPFSLIALGVGSAWVSSMEALTPYKWVLASATAALLGFGFYAAYIRPRRCAAGSSCNSCKSSRTTRIALWVATALAISGFAFEFVGPMVH